MVTYGLCLAMHSHSKWFCHAGITDGRFVNTTEIEAVEKDREGDVLLLRHDEPVICREVGGVPVRWKHEACWHAKLSLD